ncbi:HVO_A0114 family putative DNA-binding protein [Persephonella sp.]
MEQLSCIFTPKRLNLLEALKEIDVKSIKEFSLQRYFKNVYTDVKILEQLGIIKLEKK